MIKEALAACTMILTPAQELALDNAYVKGLPHDLGYTMAAIVRQESFVGKYIVRMNNTDGKYGSYGITHINLETAMYLLKYDNSWKARQDLPGKLMNSDDFSMDLSLAKLKSKEFTTWKELWASYNGSGPMAREYAVKIQNHIKEFKACNTFRSSDWS